MTRTLRTWTFWILLVGSIAIFSASLVGAFTMGMWGPLQMEAMSSPMHGAGASGSGWGSRMGGWTGLLSVLAASLVFTAAFRIRAGSEERAWGVVAIVAGALSIFAMGGYVVGTLASIVGGVLALSLPRTLPVARPS